MGPLLAFTPVMLSIAKCYSDVGMGFFGVSFGLPVFFQGLGLIFVQGDGLD
jgi:hypothetical protein